MQLIQLQVQVEILFNVLEHSVGVLGMQCFYTLEDMWESYAWGDRSHSGMSLQLGSLQTL